MIYPLPIAKLCTSFQDYLAMVVTLGYWGIRALGEPARLILRYADADWTETTIPPTKEGAGMWFGGLKQSLGLDFPNMPYLIDGEVKLTESTAIYRYLGRKYDLMPGDVIRGDLAEQLVTGLRTYITKIAYSGEFEKSKPWFVTMINTRLAEFTKFLGDGPFLFGDKVTYVDFMAFEFWEQCRRLNPDSFEGMDVVNGYLKRVASLPRIKEWIESVDCTRNTYSINSPMCAWPGFPEEVNK